MFRKTPIILTQIRSKNDGQKTKAKQHVGLVYAIVKEYPSRRGHPLPMMLNVKNKTKHYI